MPDFIGASFAASAVNPGQYPPGDWPEVAFAGRSNVGKSSLINSLCRSGRLAKTSATPGKTKTINFFAVRVKFTDGERPAKDFFLVDLPGYGYAKAAKTDKSAWSDFIRVYISASRRLRLICQLIDIRHDLMDNDARCHEWLLSTGLPVCAAFTKADKLTAAAVKAQSARLCRALSLPRDKAFIYSAVKNTGRAEFIDGITKYI